MKNLSLVRHALLSLSVLLLVLPGVHAQNLWADSVDNNGGALRTWANSQNDPSVARPDTFDQHGRLIAEGAISVKTLALHAVDKAAGNDPELNAIPDDLGDSYDRRNIRIFIARNLIPEFEDDMIPWSRFVTLGQPNEGIEKSTSGFKPLTINDLKFSLQAARNEASTQTRPTVLKASAPTETVVGEERRVISARDIANMDVVGTNKPETHRVNAVVREEVERPTRSFVRTDYAREARRPAPPVELNSAIAAEVEETEAIVTQRVIGEQDLKDLEGRFSLQIEAAKQPLAESARRDDRQDALLAEATTRVEKLEKLVAAEVGRNDEQQATLRSHTEILSDLGGRLDAAKADREKAESLRDKMRADVTTNKTAVSKLTSRFDTFSGDLDGQGGKFVWTWIVIGIIAALVIGIIVLMWFNRPRLKNGFSNISHVQPGK